MKSAPPEGQRLVMASQDRISPIADMTWLHLPGNNPITSHWPEGRLWVDPVSILGRLCVDCWSTIQERLLVASGSTLRRLWGNFVVVRKD